MAVPIRLGVWQTVTIGRHRTLLLFPNDQITGPLWLSVRGDGEALLELTADDRSPPDRPYEVRVRRGTGEVLELPAQVRVRRGECCLSAPEDETVVEVRAAGAPIDDLEEAAVSVSPITVGDGLGSLFVHVGGDVSRLAVVATSAPHPRAAPTLPPEPMHAAPTARTLPPDEPPPEFDLMPEPEPLPPAPVPPPVAETPKKPFFGRKR